MTPRQSPYQIGQNVDKEIELIKNANEELKSAMHCLKEIMYW